MACFSRGHYISSFSSQALPEGAPQPSARQQAPNPLRPRQRCPRSSYVFALAHQLKLTPHLSSPKTEEGTQHTPVRVTTVDTRMLTGDGRDASCSADCASRGPPLVFPAPLLIGGATGLVLADGGERKCPISSRVKRKTVGWGVQVTMGSPNSLQHPSAPGHPILGTE